MGENFIRFKSTHDNVFNFFQLQPNSASGSGALEHDSATVYMRLQAVGLNVRIDLKNTTYSVFHVFTK